MIAIWRFSVTVTLEVGLAIPNGIVADGPAVIDTWLANIGALVKYNIKLGDDSYDGLKVVCVSDEKKFSQIRLPNGSVLYERHH
jgi:hypothetical protein